MPELPEVETVRRELAPWLVGREIRRARRADAPAGPKYAQVEKARGQTIRAVERHGKFLVLPLSRGDELIIHLGMTGTLSPVRPADHLRVVVEFAGAGSLAPGPDADPTRGLREQGAGGPAPSALYFRDPRRFGRFLLAPGGDRSALPTLAALGPEPLDLRFTPAVLGAALARTRAAIKPVLLGQRAVAGVGNIYADEALWAARIHPATPADALTARAVATLHAALVRLLTAAVDAGGTTLRDYRTVAGDPGAYQAALQVYGQDGAPCPRCHTPLARVVLGQRGTTFCPRCQRPANAGR